MPPRAGFSFPTKATRTNDTSRSFARGHSRAHLAGNVVDLLVFALALSSISGVLTIGRYWLGAVMPAAQISHSPRALPLYALYSLVRMMTAYVLSLAFAIGYGYVAAYTPRIESVMIAALDILQSIPVLSFLPGVMLAMVALFPSRQLGLELGSIILIFTGQVLEHGVQFLLVPEIDSARVARGRRHLPLRRLAALHRA